MTDAMKLVEKTNYLNKGIQYLKSVDISEWDMHAAGFSVLKFRKLLPEDVLNEWEKLDKHMRTVKEGMLQKSRPDIAEAILTTLGQARQAFVYANNIKEDQILAIKKDALFLINANIKTSSFEDTFVFRKKNSYTSYMYLNNKEFYYDSSSDNLDVKGISEISRIKCRDGILNDIKSFMKSSEKVNPNMLFNKLKIYRKKYLNRELPIDCYREIDNDGMFRLGNYTLMNASEDILPSLDISQNYISYILPIFGIML